MLFTKTPKERASMVNCPEVFNLWDVLSSKYNYIEKLQVWSNFAHDSDLKLAINQLLKMLNKFAKELEDKLREFSVSGPDIGVKGVNTSVNTEVIHDKLIAIDILTWVQGAVELFLRSMRTTTTNDQLRHLFNKIAVNNIDFVDSFLKYVRIKGWLGVPPFYPHIPAEETEKIDAAEAFHLWDQLTFRYDNIGQTETYKSLASDAEFKALLNVGLQTILQKQAAELEKECIRFGIPLPSKPAKVVSYPAQFSNYFKDESMYRSMYFGIVGATMLHSLAVKQCTTNDRVRKIFVKLLKSELDILDRFIRYGNSKGYLHPVPEYST